MGKLKITIDRDECIGDGACVDDAPNTFSLDDEDKAVAKEPPGDDQEAIMTAAQNCPVDCIVVVDEDTGQQLHPEE